MNPKQPDPIPLVLSEKARMVMFPTVLLPNGWLWRPCPKRDGEISREARGSYHLYLDRWIAEAFFITREGE